MSEQSEPESLPLIGLCAVRERARWGFWDRTVHLVADSYVGIVQRAGGLALILPVDTRSPVHIVDALDGLLLVGGADVDPASYGAKRKPGTEATYPERDAFEIALVRAAVERGVPVLGICRGMQILNVAFGGTLLQDIAEPDGSTIHRRRLGGFEDTENHIELEDSSLAERASGEGIHIAHCHHHQAIDRLGEGLVITGRAVEDGLPEAIEAADGSWVLGVQWHPEARDESAIVEAFVEAARDRSEQGRLVTG
jgi:putative glutamine amidotransferase